jgi:glycine oxidase
LAAKQVVVIGGGIVGCVTAMQLIEQGYQVTVVERNAIASQTSGEASWAGAGIVFPLLPWMYRAEVNALALEGAALYPALASKLFNATGIDAECIKSGMLVYPPFNQLSALEWCALNKVAAYIQGTNLWLPDVLQVRNPRLMQALKQWLINNNATLLEQTSLLPIDESKLAINGAIPYVQTNNGQTITADAFVVTSGAWSFELLKQTSLQLNIKPMRGQMLLYKLTTPLPNAPILYQDGFYLVPREDGYLLAGSTLEDVGFDTGVTQAVKQEMQAKAEAILPALKTASIEKHWSGLRPGTPENLPTIAQHPSIHNLYLNTGHFRYGVTMAPASARVIASIIQSTWQ